jgi:hypothetical protein
MRNPDPDDLDGPTSHSELLKVEYEPVMRALHRAMKRFCKPGIQSGIAEVAELLGKSEHAMRHQFGPTCYDHAPTVHAFLQMIETLQPREVVHEIAALADCVTIPRKVSARHVGAPESDLEAFARLAHMASARVATTKRALEGGRPLNSRERDEAREVLFDLIAYTAHLLTRIR